MNYSQKIEQIEKNFHIALQDAVYEEEREIIKEGAYEKLLTLAKKMQVDLLLNEKIIENQSEALIENMHFFKQAGFEICDDYGGISLNTLIEEALDKIKKMQEELDRQTDRVKEYQETIATYREFDAKPLMIPNPVCEEIKEMLMNQTIEVIKEPDWIPCSERLPEKEALYLTTIEFNVGGKDKFHDLLFFRDNKWWHMGDQDYTDLTLAWMPLPEPWRGE